MESLDGTDSASELTSFLTVVRSKGVVLWSEAGELKYRSRRGALSDNEVARLRNSKSEVIALLESRGATPSGNEVLRAADRFHYAPPAFSQLAHWRLYRLAERASIRQVASATRLTGRLAVEVLQQSLIQVVRRHAALRTQIVVRDGELLQLICDQGGSKMEVVDLTAIHEYHRDAEIDKMIEEFVISPIDISTDPLFGVRLLKLSEHEHVLIIALEHMISDASSISIVLRDLFAIYTKLLRREPYSLPEVTVQFFEYSHRQRKTHGEWVRDHEGYWDQRLAGYQKPIFPNTLGTTETDRGWETVPIRIGKSVAAELRAWCRLHHTTIAMGVFTAYVGATLRSYNVSKMIFQFQSDGRCNTDTENTVGYFASSLYLMTELLSRDRFVDLMRRLEEEYCKAYEHADFYFMESQVPRPGFARSPGFNWIPQGSLPELSELHGSEYAITCSAIPFIHPMLRRLQRDDDPVVLLHDVEGEIIGELSFPVNLFPRGAMEKVASNFMLFVVSLLRKTNIRVSEIPLC
jgi:Condensation domain/TubC N-terminal docking domain